MESGNGWDKLLSYDGVLYRTKIFGGHAMEQMDS